MPYIFLLILILPISGFSATEHGTFESFYTESSWISWILIALVAIISGAVVYFSGGTLTPVVSSIGTWIGSTMGLSGVAATNAGLAFLGGGAIASGGLGMAGGSALLTSALTFSTEVIIDYTVNKAINDYNYHQLAETSKKLPTLPLPVNTSGFDAYEKAINALENVDDEKPLSIGDNLIIINRAISIIQKDKENLDDEEKIQKYSFLALLYFNTNSYKNARENAEKAIDFARHEKLRRTLPAFIYASSSLYLKNTDIEKITQDYFRYSILAEPDNPIIPFLFSIYLDRLILRMNDDLAKEEMLLSIFLIMQDESLEDLRFTNYSMLLMKYFFLLKDQQQKISSLSLSQNERIRQSSITLHEVEKSIIKYENLLKGAHLINHEILSLDSAFDKENGEHTQNNNALLINYTDDKVRLAKLINDLRLYQESSPIKQKDITIAYPYVIFFVTCFILLILLLKKNNTN